MDKAVTRGQALEVIGRLTTDTKWEYLDGAQLQREVINLSRVEFARRFLSWLQNGAPVVGTQQTSLAGDSQPALTKWRTFLIGGVAKKALLQRVKAGFEVGSYAEDIMKKSAFTTLDKEEAIDTIVLTPADFGYTWMPTTTELFDPTRLREWSMQNAERLDGHVIELLPAEAGPHIRDQYRDQPNGEVLWIAMERIGGSDGRPSVFYVGRDDHGEQWLRTDWARPDGQWLLGDRIVFRLRKVTKD